MRATGRAVSRSKHTRPRRILAADRVASPQEPRSTGDTRSRNRTHLRYKRSGIALIDDVPARGKRGSVRVPVIQVQRSQPGYQHVLKRSEVEAVLRCLGPECVYGLRSVVLARRPQGDASRLRLGRLVAPGRLLLYEQPLGPWLLSGRLRPRDGLKFVQSGAQVEELATGTTRVLWPAGSLRRFMLLEVLTHELAHHSLQQYKGKRGVRVARTGDHEASAGRIALRLSAWLEAEL
jgi:hypothetical protein